MIILSISTSFAQEINLSVEKKIQSLIDKFSEKDPFENGAAITELSKMGEIAIVYLIKSLQHDTENVRWCSAITLEKIAPAGQQAIPYLITALNDTNSNVRWCAALALGKYKSAAEPAITELHKLLYDQDDDVRWAAYISLSQIDRAAINQAPQFSEVINKLENIIPQLMKKLNVPGVSISIIKNNKIEWSHSFGLTDVIQKTKVNAVTVFEACSMSKPIFAYSVLKLVEQGKLDLDKPLCNYMAEYFISAETDYAKQVTARMVLSHTSGMPNWRKGGEERMGPLPIYFKPGIKFSYSGEGIYYLQRVVEHITKEPLEIYAKRTLFDQLGLCSTSFVWTENLNQQIATGHDSSGNCLERSKYLHSNAAYTLYTTADEYARLMIAILNPDYQQEYSLSAGIKTEMLAHQVRVDVRDVINRPGRFLGLLAYRGLGWAIDSTITHDIVYHSGSNQTGFRCYSQFSLQDGSGIVIMSNGVNGSELWSRLISSIGDL